MIKPDVSSQVGFISVCSGDSDDAGIERKQEKHRVCGHNSNNMTLYLKLYVGHAPQKCHYYMQFF